MSVVYIRPLVESDALVSYKWRNDPEVWKFTGSKPSQEITHEIERAWLAKVLADPTTKRFAIIADGKYIGNIQLTNIVADNAEYHIFIGDKDYWGKGIAKIATFQILNYAFNEIQLNSVYLSVRTDNVAAIKVYEKGGFHKAGQAEEWLKMQCTSKTIPVPMVSVFVMVYNQGKFLKECLDGLLMQQTNFPVEIVVGEDYSTDDSRKILIEYRKLFPGRFNLLLHEKNIGAIANQKVVLVNCTGNYLAMCEGDDYWTDPLKLQKQVDFMDSNLDFSICFHKIEINKDGSIIDDYITKVPAIITTQKDLVDLDNYIHTPSVLIRKGNMIFPEWLYNSLPGDYPMYIVATNNGGKIYYMEEVMAHYRVHSGGAWSGNRSKYAQKIAMTYYNIATYIRDKPKIKESLFKIAYSIEVLGYDSIKPADYYRILKSNLFKMKFTPREVLRLLKPVIKRIAKVKFT